MRVIILKRHRKVVTLAEVEQSLYEILETVSPLDRYARDKILAERKHLRSRFLFATEFEVPDSRDLTDEGWE